MIRLSQMGDVVALEELIRKLESLEKGSPLREPPVKRFRLSARRRPCLNRSRKTIGVPF